MGIIGMHVFFTGNIDARYRGHGKLETEAQTSGVVQKDSQLLHVALGQDALVLRKSILAEHFSFSQFSNVRNSVLDKALG